MAKIKRVSAGRYEVSLDGVVLGHVWKDSGERERLTRWGVRNAAHPTHTAHWWRCSGEDEEFPTREEAVWFLSTQSGREE